MRLIKSTHTLKQLQALLITSIWVLSTLFVNNQIIKAVFSVAFLSLAPGYFLYRVIAGYVESQPRIKIMAYSLGLSLISLMTLGLAVNQIAPLLGDKHPLSTGLLTVSIGAFTAVLIILNGFLHRKHSVKKFKITRAKLKKHIRVLKTGLISLLLPILAIGGATTLNNDGSGWLAMTVIGIVTAYFLVLVWKKPGHELRYPIALFGTSLAILYGISMRGWNITGHDIMQEYQVFELTLQHMAWHINYYQDAYNACLSITILPTIFQKLTGIEPQYIYKLIFQIFFAAISPIMYLTLRDYVNRKTALLSVLTFIVFPTFLVDMSMLNRQEIAFVCFALSLMAALDKKLSRHIKSVLITIFLMGMIFSHYSTSYLTLGALIISLGLGLIYAYRKKIFIGRELSKKKVSKLRFWIYGPPIMVITLLGIYGWGTLATHTTTNITQNISAAVHSVPGLFKSSTSNAPPQINATTPQAIIAEYDQTITKSRVFPPDNYFSNAASYSVHPVPEALEKETSVGKGLHLSVSSINSVFDKIPELYALYIFGGAVLGIFLILSKKIRSYLPIQYFLMGLAFFVLVALTHYAPDASINYSVVRELQQTLIVAGLPIIVGSLWILKKFKLSMLSAQRIVGIGLITLFLAMSGFIPAIIGGYKPSLALSNSGFYYEAYYTHQDEITATDWLVNSTPVGSRVYSDEFARRMIIAYSDSKIFSQPTLVPTAIPIDSYVFLSDTNTTLNTVPVYPNQNVAYYNVPYAFLNTNKNLIYSGGDVDIYYSTNTNN